MEREAFTLAMRHVEAGPEETTAPLPTLEVHYDGPGADLRAALAELESQGTDPDFDVSFRFQADDEAIDADGVLAVTDRLTGDYVCECNARSNRVFEFLTATKRRAAAIEGTPKYRVQFVVSDTPIRTEELATFLVYTESGELRESKSLLPNGVEL